MGENMINKIHNKDFFEFMGLIENESVDLILTDPPYSQEAHGRGIAGKREIFTDMQKWTNLSNDWYSDEILELLESKCKKVNVFLFCCKKDLVKVIQRIDKKGYNFHVMQCIKDSPIPFTNNDWLSSEYAVHYSDGAIMASKSYHDKIPHFRFKERKQTLHPNEKPLNEVCRIINNLLPEGGTVVDPFNGSGTTSLACHMFLYNFICNDIDPAFVEMAEQRIKDYDKQYQLFT